MHQVAHSQAIRTNAAFEASYHIKVRNLLSKPAVNRGAAHAMKDDTTASTHELLHVTETFEIGEHMGGLQAMFKPNLPWAEDHFQERISGEPLNPSPSEEWWPFARQGNAEHKKDQVFSHTYPERFWPRFANEGGKCADSERVIAVPIVGIRFEYGDFYDLIKVLRANPWSRQAYLPIWFPEDLAAARQGERVPCSLGYHFLRTEDGTLDCTYTLRSCDIVRFYRDDMYMAGRLLQVVAYEVGLRPGTLVTHINNLHCFPGDRAYLESLLPGKETYNPRAGYNFDALY